MPRGDGTGPRGMGAGTGRGLGACPARGGGASMDRGDGSLRRGFRSGSEARMSAPIRRGATGWDVLFSWFERISRK
ncbi:MAG: DUF5320 domain-containing protein [Deltaproteobacteria bacterium]|nr:DUF5320 domain-containing protein [Deltaproteobacteria bacterium]